MKGNVGNLPTRVVGLESPVVMQWATPKEDFPIISNKSFRV